jgi:AcrR family transcriptional regulator
MTAAGSARLPRGTLDPTTILEAAMAVVAEVGVDALTVPAVARHLDVGPTAIYWHYRRKDDLLEALDNHALEQFNALFPDLPAEPWQENVRAYWTQYRRILRERPVLRELVIVRWAKSMRSPAAVQQHFARIDGQIAVLLAAGFTAEQAARAYHVLSTFTRGCLLNERTAELALSANVDASVPNDLDAGAGRYPALHEVRTYWNATFATDADFGAGVDLVLNGLVTQLAAAAPTVPPNG